MKKLNQPDTVVLAALRDLMRRTPDMVFIKDASLRYLGASRAFVAITNCSEPESLVGKTDAELFDDPELARRYADDDRRLLAGGVPLENYVEPFHSSDEGPRYCQTSKYILYDEAGGIAGLYGISRDITREYEAKRSYEQELSALFDLPKDVLLAVLFDVTGWRVVDTRHGASGAGVSPVYGSIEEFIGNAASSVVDNEEAQRFFLSLTKERLYKLFGIGKRSLTMEYRRRLPDGNVRWVRDELHFLLDPVNGHLTVIVLLRDIHEEKCAENALMRAAEVDAMTGLLNREATMRQIRRYLEGEGAAGKHALFMVDVDNFKLVNDTFGHQVGDDVLTDIARAIRRTFRDTDTVGRIGGDEFFALMKNCGSRSNIVQKARELSEAMQYLYAAHDQRIDLSGSIGVSLFKGGGKTLETLYEEADTALYKAKMAGKNRFVIGGAGDEPRRAMTAGDGAMNTVHLRTLLENMEGAVLMTEVRDGEIHVVYASPSEFHKMNRSETEIGTNGEHVWNVVQPEDLAGLRHAILEAARTHTVLDHIYRARGEAGAAIWRHVRGSCLPGQGDGVCRLLAVVTDVTAMKENEERLAFAELRYRTAAEQSGLLLWTVDIPSKTLTFCGPAAERLGLAGRVFSDPLHGRIADGAIHPDSTAAFIEMYESIYAGREGRDYTIVTVGADGQEFAGRARYSLLRRADGTPYCAVGTSTSFLEERELALYRTMSHGGVFSVRLDEGYTLLYGNDRYYAIHEYTRESMRDRLNNHCRGYILPDDLPLLERALRDGAAAGYAVWTMRVVTGLGNLKYTQVSGEFVRQTDGSTVMNGVAIDVTEQKQAELTLKQQKADADAQYRMMLALRTRVDENAIGSFRMNLTKNTCDAGRSDSDRILALQKDGTADGFLDSLCALAADPAQTSALRDVFSRASLLARFAQGETNVTGELLLPAPPAGCQWVRVTTVMLRNPASGDVECLIYAENIDREKMNGLMVDQLIDQNLDFVALIDAGAACFKICRSSRIRPGHAPESGAPYRTQLERAAKLLTGGQGAEALIRGLDFANVLRALREHGRFAFSFPVRMPGGEVRNKEWRASWLDERHDTILYSQSDVTALYEAETDPLTGAYNRQAFYRHVREMLDANPGRESIIIRFDIDRFKAFNDVFGTAAGDRLLSDIGGCVRGEWRQSAVFGRIEGDHFAILAPTDMMDPLRWGDALARWLAAYSPRFRLTASVGVYAVSDPKVDVSLMCDRALLALRTVKENYTDKVAWYDDSLRRSLMEEQTLINEMDAALESGQFVLYFQPQVSYESGRLIGAEALVRWNHPRRGLIMPDRFIPLFEKNGFITKLDEYVWDRCCAYMRAWLDRDDKLLPVSVAVNISRFDIYDPKLCEKLRGLVEKYSLPATALKLEITESAYMENPGQLIAVVKEMQAAGFTVEMDDFGAGYSSLNTLKDVPVDILKLDVRFLSKGEDDARGGSILSSIIRMAHWLKLPVIAEGVETKAQADYLKSLNCFYMQGYYFGRPMPAEAFEKMLVQSDIGEADRYRDVNLEGMASFWDASAQTAMLFNSYVGGAAIVEYDGRQVELLRTNDNFYRNLGTTRETYGRLVDNLLDDFNGENRDAFLRMLDEAVRTGGETVCEVQNRPDALAGPGIWTHNRAHVLAKNGDRYLIYISAENVTERKRMEEQLRLSREELQLAISRMGKILVHYDLETHTLVLPEEYARLHGVPNRIAGVPETNRPAGIAKEDEARWIAFYRGILADKPDCEVSVRVCSAKGGYRWEHYTASVIRDGAGAAIRAVIAVEDITVRREREAENERNRLLLERTGVCLFDYDVLSGRLHFETNVPDHGTTVLDIPDYIEYVKTSARIHPDSREPVRRMLREAAERPATGTLDYIGDNWNTGLRWCRIHYAGIADEGGRVYRIVGQISDVQQEKDRAALIAELTARLGGHSEGLSYNSVLLERVLNHLYGARDTESAVQRILETIGSHYDVSRAYIFEDIEDHACCSNTFEWCAPGVTPEIENLKRLSYKEDLGGTYHESLNEDGVLYCPDIRVLPAPQRAVLEPQGIRAMLQCAILDNGVFTGYIGFDDCHENRIWTEEQVSTLTLISKLVGAFLIKGRKTAEAAFSSDFRAAMDDNPAYLYVVDPDSYEVIYDNKAIRRVQGYSSVGKLCYREFIGVDAPCAGCPLAAAARGEAASAEIRRSDGMWLLSQASMLQWNGREMAVIACTDITAYKRDKAGGRETSCIR